MTSQLEKPPVVAPLVRIDQTYLAGYPLLEERALTTQESNQIFRSARLFDLLFKALLFIVISVVSCIGALGPEDALTYLALLIPLLPVAWWLKNRFLNAIRANRIQVFAGAPTHLPIDPIQRMLIRRCTRLDRIQEIKLLTGSNMIWMVAGRPASSLLLIQAKPVSLTLPPRERIGERLTQEELQELRAIIQTHIVRIFSKPPAAFFATPKIVMQLNQDRKAGVIRKEGKGLEMLPSSGMIWTERGRPASWRATARPYFYRPYNKGGDDQPSSSA